MNYWTGFHEAVGDTLALSVQTTKQYKKFDPIVPNY
jgi:hypothetical protein